MSIKRLFYTMASTSNENINSLQNEELSEFNNNVEEASNNMQISNNVHETEIMDDNFIKRFEGVKLENFKEISNKVDTSSHIKNDLKLESSVSTEISNNIGKTDQMIYKLRLSEPYNIFYNKIPGVKETQNAITFSDLLCPSLGELERSLQISYAVDLKWLLEQYKKHNFDKKPLTILFDSRMNKHVVNCMKNLNEMDKNYKIKYKEIKNGPGFHHSKIGLYYYEDMSVRVVVSSANLNSIQWNKCNQNLWISPACPKLSEDQPNGAACGAEFKKQLLGYLKTYKLDELNEWIKIVERTDFSKIKVFLITSVPGYYVSTSTTCHINYVRLLLSKHCKIPKDENWTIIAQASSIGSLKSDFLKNITNSETGMKAAIIYPSASVAERNCFKSIGKLILKYARKVHLKQENWIKYYFHEWKAELLERSEIMPHTKTYYQINDDHSRMAYYLLTSANISEAAWGRYIDDKIYVKNHEVGVMFLPKFFNETYFKISTSDDDKIFPLMVDLPLKPYLENDTPFTRNK